MSSRRITEALNVGDNLFVGKDKVSIHKSNLTLSDDLQYTVENLRDPKKATDAASKQWVESLLPQYKEACDVATVLPLSAVYDNGDEGVGATLTGTATNPWKIDNQDVTVGARVLVKDQVIAYENGIYKVTSLGASYTLTRSTDANTALTLSYAFVYVNGGDVNGHLSYIESAKLSTIGIDTVTFIIYSLFKRYLTFRTGIISQ